MATAAPTVDVVLVHPDDNVCVAARDLDLGTEITAGRATVTLTGRVPHGAQDRA